LSVSAGNGWRFYNRRHPPHLIFHREQEVDKLITELYTPCPSTLSFFFLPNPRSLSYSRGLGWARGEEGGGGKGLRGDLKKEHLGFYSMFKVSQSSKMFCFSMHNL